MAFLPGDFSLWDEHDWGFDSSTRSSSFRLEEGAISLGEVSTSLDVDWYSLRLSGSGTFRITVSNDSLNNYTGNFWNNTTSGVRVQLTDAFGVVYTSIGFATAIGSADGSLSFTYTGEANTSDYYVKVSNLGLGAADYALMLELTGGITHNGTSGADSTVGSPLADSLSGSSGNDTLWGMAGSDTLRGGTGDDQLEGWAGDDSLDGGDGVDVASYGDASFGVSVNLATGRASGGAGNDTLAAIEDLYGSPYGDTLTGSSGANYLDGDPGNDSIAGGAGDDLLRGDPGNDTLDGGDGNDSAFFDATRAAANVTYNAALQQFTIVSASDGTDLVRNVETLFFAGVAYSAASLANPDTIAGSSATTAVLTIANGIAASISSAIDSNGDSDWIVVTLTAGTEYQFDLFGSEEDGAGLGLTLADPQLQLRNSAGTSLRTNDNSGVGLNARIIYTPTASGTYYLDVQESGNNATGTWRLFANVAPVAGSVAVGGSVSGDINAVGDVDDHSVSLVAGVTYTITLQGNTLGDPFLEIADSGGTVLDWDDDSGAGLDAQLSFTPGLSGTYYIAARESGHDATGSYTLSVANLDTIPGGTSSTATVAVGGSVSSEIDFGSDSDYFRVQLVAGTTYQFDLLGSAADGGSRTLDDPWLALANSTGTILAWNDDSGVGFNSRISYTPTASGTYFLIAEESGYDATGSYKLLVNSTPQAGSIVIGTPRTGAVEPAGDIDVYSVTLTAGTTYRLTLQGNTLAHPFLELLDASGAVIDFGDSGSGNLAQIDFTPTSTASYQLLARDSGHDSSGSYTLTVAFPDSVPGSTSTQSTLYSGKGDGTVTSSIDFAGDTDWWRATLATGYGYQIWMEGDSSGLGTLADPYLRLLNSAGVQQQFNNDVGAGTFDAYLYAVPSSGGSYYVSAEEFGHNATGTYTLTLWRDALASSASATSVAFNNYYDERIGWIDDTSDWISVSLTGGTTYQFDLIGADGDGSAAGLTLLDPWLKLRTSAGVLLDEDDNSGLLSNARIVFTPSVSGSYFLESYLPPDGDDYGQYRLIVNALPAITALTPGAPISDELQFAGDVDQFSISLAAGITYTFTLAGNTLGDPYLELLDSTRAVVVSDDDSGDGLDARLTYTPSSSGSYFVSARASAHLSTGSYTVSVTASGVAAGAFESEDNNRSTLADALALGTRLSGALADRDDDDWFTLNVGAAGTLAIEFDVPTNSTLDYFRIGVWDNASHQLANFVTGSDKTYQVSAPAAGSYFVVVDSPQYHSAGSYGLKVTHTAGGSGIESEPNEVYANALLSGSAIAGQLAAAADVDWFYFATTAPSELALVFDAPTNSALTDYFQIRVLDAAGNLLASRAGGADLSFNVAAPAAGNYFVSVNTANGSDHDTGTYRLTVTANAASTLREVEPNNAAAQANAVPLPGAIRGQLSSNTDADGYLVATAGAGTLTVRLDAPTASTWGTYFRVAVYAPNGTLLASRDTGGDIAFDVTVSEAGNHRVVISAAAQYSGGEYELALSAAVTNSTPAGAIKGTPAADTLVGTAGADTIAGLGGNDLIDGGAGTDTAFFRAAASNLTINTIEGLTAVRGNYAAGEHAYTVSRLWNVERITTDSGTTLIGSAGASPRLGTAQADRIAGTAGADLIDGLGGSDFIDGDAGSDTLVLFGPQAAFSVLTIAGITRIRGDDSSFEYAGHLIRSVNVERLAFTQSQTRTLEVTATNKLFGSPGADSLLGTSAADVIDGLGGNDTVDGGAGSDTLVFFGRRDEFTISFPSASDSALRVTGKSGDYAGQTVRALNVESLAFADAVVGVTNPPGIVATPATTLVAEGGSTAALAISLKVAPSASVTVRLAGGTQLDASAATLTFTTANWNQAQSVTISAKNDTAPEKQHTGTLTISVESADAGYAALAPSTIDYTITDNDSAALGAVAGRLWNDADRDGAIDAGEAPLAGWRVFDDVNRNGSLDSGEAFATTDTSGAYRLNDLAAGEHTIVARSEPGWVVTAPGGDATVSSVVIQNQAGGGTDGLGFGTGVELGVDILAAAGDYANLGAATRIADFHADARFAGIQGRGYAVVVIDSGADLDHADFGPDGNGDGVADRIVYQFDFAGANDPNASDTEGHGTHVAGTIGSSDANFPGIAPEVSLIVLKVAPDGSRSMARDDVREALNWVVQNHAQYNVVAVNMSLSGGEFHTVATNGAYSSQIAALTAAGLVVVAASGNNYTANPVQGVGYPSSDPYALSVGAVWATAGELPGVQVGVVDAIAAFSQRDDSESDIFAPGGHVVATKLGGGHVALDGTSMASPQIAGMVVLAQQVAQEYLGRRLTFFEIRDLLRTSGDAIVDGDDEADTVPNTGLTFKRVDMVALAEAVLALKPPTSYTVNVTAGNTVADRNFGFAGSAVVQGLAGDDIIAGTYLGDILRGGGGNDRIDGGADNDAIYGEIGDDDLTSGTGDDFIDGGEGSDTAIFLARRDAFTISWDSASGTYTLVSGGTGRDQVRGVEFFEFANGTLAAAQLIDSAPPTLSSTIPADGASNAAAAANLVLTFNEPVEWGNAAIVLKTAAGATVETFNAGSPAARASFSGAVLTLDPTAALVAGTGYRLTIEAGALRDLAGNAIAANDSFDFTVASAANAAPTSSNGSGTVAEDGVLSATLPAATDPNGDAISYAKASDPAHGTLTINANGSYSYTPAANYNGSDSFGFRVADPGGAGNSYTINLTVTPVNDAPGGSVTISGTARVGQLLTAAQTASDIDGLGTLAYQWLRGGSAIGGATGTSYTLVAADVGQTISLRLSWTDGGGTAESLTSAATAPVQAAVNVITGSAAGEPLTGTSGSDSILGLAGNDVLNGSSGSDTLDGGEGFDIASYGPSSGATPINASLLTGIVTQGSDTDTLIGIEALFGSKAADTIRAADGPATQRGETIRGGQGNDTIDGGTGVDAAEYLGARAGYSVTRNGNAISVVGSDGSDSLLNVERLVFADSMLAFGTRAEELARVAFVLWTPGIVGSTALFSRGYSYYDNGGYDFATMCGAALTFHNEQGLAFAQKLKANMPGTAKSVDQIFAIMNAAGGGEPGRIAALVDMANDPATEAAIAASNVRVTGIVADLAVQGFGTLFGLLPGG